MPKRKISFFCVYAFLTTVNTTDSKTFYFLIKMFYPNLNYFRLCNYKGSNFPILSHSPFSIFILASFQPNHKLWLWLAELNLCYNILCFSSVGLIESIEFQVYNNVYGIDSVCNHYTRKTLNGKCNTVF